MEIALKSIVSSSSSSSSARISSTTIGGGAASLLGEQNVKHKSESGGAGHSGIGFNNGLLSLLGTSPGGFKNEAGLTASSDYELLASLTLKNALNVNSDANVAGRQQPQHQPCNSNILTSQQQQQKQSKIFTITSGALLATSATKKQSTSICSKTNTSSSNIISSLACSTINTSSSAMAAASITTTTKSTSSTLTGTTTTSGNSNVGVSSGKNSLQIPSDILDDLASRFIINVPDMELSNLIRICFQIELAHWFYLDFFCASSAEQQQDEDGNKKKKLPSCGIKQFAIQIFQHIPFLREHLSTIDKILDDWKNYKLSVPTYGAILISEDLNYCLLVQSYFAKSSWGFPKGKVNENEDPVHCATREVYEETGYDITELIVPNDYIEAVINYQYTRLYIVRDVSLQTQFSPRTRNEIKCCDWFPIDSLPVNKNDAISKAKLGINANSFFMIMPFVKRLKKWVHDIRETGTDSRRKYSGGGGSNSPISNSPTTLMTTAAAATAAAVAGNTSNYNSNQKHTNANNSNKKNKQHSNGDDKHNALNSGGVVIVANNNNNNNNNNNAGTATSNNSNRSKRQRHKSMGDLDGIKLNNLSSNTCSQSNNCKKATTISTTAANNLTTTTTTTVSTVSDINIGNSVGGSGTGKGGSNHKRNSNSAKLAAAGSSSSGNHNNNNGVAGCVSSKRQLFHSQSQSGGNQHGEKIVSSFDLIRKEKQQQMKAAAQTEKTAAKANKQNQHQQQQQQPNGGGSNGRVRAKSQGDKMSMQQQNAHKNSNTNNVSNKQRVQKQQSMIVCNSNSTHNTNCNNNINNNSNGNYNASLCKSNVGKSRSPPPLCGAELLALAAESVVALNATAKATVSAPNTAQKPRPASVSLHFATPPPPATDATMQQLQRMASGTNLRILKRSTSYQPQQQHPIQRLQGSQQKQQNQEQEDEQKRQQQPLTFTPSFNSWTNFSFTKNFIANVFC